MSPMDPLRKMMGAVDGFQRRVRWVGVPYAVQKKFGDDNANLVVVALAWYGFTAIFPLLLVVVTVFGFIGKASIGTGLINTLHQFPVDRLGLQPGKQHLAPRKHDRAGRRPHRPALRRAGRDADRAAGDGHGLEHPAGPAHRLPAAARPQSRRADHHRRRIPHQRVRLRLSDRRNEQLRDQNPDHRGPSRHQRRPLFRHLHPADGQGDRPARAATRRDPRRRRLHRADHRRRRADHPPAEAHVGDLRHVRHGHRHRGVPAAAGQAQPLRRRAESRAVPQPVPPRASAGWRADGGRPAGPLAPGASGKASRRPGDRRRLRRRRRRRGGGRRCAATPGFSRPGPRACCGRPAGRARAACRRPRPRPARCPPTPAAPRRRRRPR